MKFNHGAIVLLFIIILFSFSSCKKDNKWEVIDPLMLEEHGPIGIASLGKELWIADGDKNKVVVFDRKGKKIREVEGFDRPMHLAAANNKVYIPEYGSDQIAILDGSKPISYLSIGDSIDAPAGIALSEGKIAIADFYNHRILFTDGKKWDSVGKEGKKAGEFYYPTDVHYYNDKMYVADAYNNRIQVFTNDGKHLATYGQGEEMNAATGIYVSDKGIFITDFENDRILIFDHDGELIQVLEEGIEKPTDLLIEDGILYVANYGGKSLARFK